MRFIRECFVYIFCLETVESETFISLVHGLIRTPYFCCQKRGENVHFRMILCSSHRHKADCYPEPIKLFI